MGTPTVPQGGPCSAQPSFNPPWPSIHPPFLLPNAALSSTHHSFLPKAVSFLSVHCNICFFSLHSPLTVFIYPSSFQAAYSTSQYTVGNLSLQISSGSVTNNLKSIHTSYMSSWKQCLPLYSMKAIYCTSKVFLKRSREELLSLLRIIATRTPPLPNTWVSAWFKLHGVCNRLQNVDEPLQEKLSILFTRLFEILYTVQN